MQMEIGLLRDFAECLDGGIGEDFGGIARVVHSRDELDEVGLAKDGGHACGEVDRGLLHARNCAESFVDSTYASAASHALNVEGCFCKGYGQRRGDPGGWRGFGGHAIMIAKDGV